MKLFVFVQNSRLEETSWEFTENQLSLTKKFKFSPKILDPIKCIGIKNLFRQKIIQTKNDKQGAVKCTSQVFEVNINSSLKWAGYD
jgi:hypothetical protein